MTKQDTKNFLPSSKTGGGNMGKYFLIARSNLRKSKGQTVAIIVLIILAAFLLNLWLMISIDYSANFSRQHDALNAEHVMFTIDDESGEAHDFLKMKLDNDEKVEQYRLDSCLQMTGTFEYNDGEMNTWLVFMEKELALNRNIGKSEIVEEGNLDSGIYMPLLYKTKDIDIGKSIEISIGSNVMEYTICGFFNNIMMGSNNCGLTQMMLTKDKYEELGELNYALKSTLCSIRLLDKNDNLNYEAYIKSVVSKQFPNATSIIGNDYDMVFQARYISQSICSMVISAMAAFVLLIALAVMVSNIINYIQVSMNNLGALKATGYTSLQLIRSLLLQFLGLTFIASLVGVAISYISFPSLNAMMIAQTGIPYKIRFLPIPMLLALLILGGATALAVWLAARRIKKIEPIIALRSGVQTHNFKRNHIPLDKTKAPLNLSLALKTTLSGAKNNVAICITMFALSFVVAFSGVMSANIIADTTPFINLIIGETADSCINVKPEYEEEFLKEVKQDSRVKKAYLYTTANVTHVEGAELLATVGDFENVNNPNIIYQGRFPKYDNEIALGAKYAKEKSFEIGNEIEIVSNGKTEKFLICGLTQITNYLGRDCLITREGYEHFGKLTNASYYINLAEDVDVNAFNEEIKEKFPGQLNSTINIAAVVETGANIYVSLMRIIVIVILFISVIIITFVLYLLVRTMLNNKMRDYGILKSLGFTTGQLILQTALSFMPAIVVSSIIGLVISGVTINPILSLFFSGLGILKCTFVIPVDFMAIVGAGLILLSFAITCLLSLKIKKIAPRNLLVGE